MQWHPLFADLLRPLLERSFEVRTNMPVGDLPRAADLVLLRRTSSVGPPFLGLWRWLTAWNILEFKGPSVSARLADLDLLAELGLGIHRRLNDERRKQGQRLVGRAQVSFWYLANHLGRRFLAGARDLLGDLEPLGPGVWRVEHLGRAIILVSNRDVPVEHDSVPVHLLVHEPLDATRLLAQEVTSRPELWRLYGPWLATLFPQLWEEVRQMARRASQQLIIDFRPIVDKVGLDVFIRQLGLERMINQGGLKQVIDLVGVKRVIEEVGAERVIEELGLEGLLAGLKPAQRRELREMLK